MDTQHANDVGWRSYLLDYGVQNRNVYTYHPLSSGGGDRDRQRNRHALRRHLTPPNDKCRLKPSVRGGLTLFCTTQIRPRIFRIRHPWSGTLCQNSQGRCGNQCKKPGGDSRNR
ncbi:hypothetical protein Bbelb_402980 [Branchiostoma belcheri]|nr:hypothetical protein Bbelb_402980 [Branchiostoma belcheri]